MIKKTAKSFLSCVIILYFVFLTLFGLGDYLYPDEIWRPTGVLPEEKLCFSFGENAESDALSSAEESLDCTVMAFGFLPIKNIRVNFQPMAEVICGGELFGVRIQADGLLVTATGSVKTDGGNVSPGELAGIRKGDLLLSADGVALTSAAELKKIVSRCTGDAIKLEVERNGETLWVRLTPALAAEGGGYKAGLWVRDGAAGLGTVTFRIPETSQFGGLGHAVCDSQSGTVFPFRNGQVCEAVIEGIKKGENGTPGELRGKLNAQASGKLLANTTSGVFGIMETSDQNAKTTPVGSKDEVKTGKATLVCTLGSDGKKEYEMEIEEIIGMDQETKNFILRITDQNLIDRTGGIVQGMSGSPILQNGKLVGAVTHVLVDDPTRGYGIFIENMMVNMPE